MLKIKVGIVCFVISLLLFAVMAQAGGVDPKEIPPQEPVAREKVLATAEQTTAAVSKVRQAVAPIVSEAPAVNKVRQAVAPIVQEAPAVKEVQMYSAPAKAVATASNDSWLLGSREGNCAPLTSIKQKVKNIGSFTTPQGFSHQMKQRGYQTFVLDIGDVRDQMMRVKVPDLDLDLLFVRPGMCR